MFVVGRSKLQTWQVTWCKSRLYLAPSNLQRCQVATRALPQQHESTADQQRVAEKAQPSTSTSTSTTAKPAAPYVIGTSLSGRTAPEAPPVTDAQLDSLAEFIQDANGQVLVITGAGCSTESNVPDYRGPNGAYSTGFKPMTHQQFMASPQNRARYWSRSFAGWYTFSKARPNAAHEGIARLEKLGWVSGIITQNVDRLHHKAGSSKVVELHGTTHEVCCMNCGEVTPRETLQAKMAALNPEAAEAAQQLLTLEDAKDEMKRLLRAGTLQPVSKNLKERDINIKEVPIQRPDGDVELQPPGDEYQFIVPPCGSCGGILKPHVVFFGDNVPVQRADDALELASNARCVLAAGTSLTVWSAYRLVKAAVENGGRLGMVNVGPTRADDLAELKLEGVVGETLIRLASQPSMLVPPSRF